MSKLKRALVWTWRMTLGRLPERARGPVILALVGPVSAAALYFTVWDENDRSKIQKEMSYALDLKARHRWPLIRYTDSYHAAGKVQHDMVVEPARAELRARPFKVGGRVKAIRTQTDRGRGHPKRLVQATATLVAFERDDEVRLVFDDSGREVTRSRVDVYDGLPAIEPDDGRPVRTGEPLQ